MHPLIVGITGASGAVYARRLLDVLTNSSHTIHLTISPSGKAVLKQELDLNVDLDDFGVDQLDLPSSSERRGQIEYFHYQDFMAPIASGSCLTAGMVVCPCSGGTLSSIAHGTSTNLVQRAADVQLKERRPLILVPRETPLSLVHLDNMRRAAEVGAVVLPAMPGWYHGVQTISDLVDFVVARILDQLQIEHPLMRRWGGDLADV